MSSFFQQFVKAKNSQLKCSMSVIIATCMLWLTAFCTIQQLPKILCKMHFSPSGEKHSRTRHKMEACKAGYRQLSATKQLIKYAHLPIVITNGHHYRPTMSRILQASSLMYGNRPGRANNIELFTRSWNKSQTNSAWQLNSHT